MNDKQPPEILATHETENEDPPQEWKIPARFKNWPTNLDKDEYSGSGKCLNSIAVPLLVILAILIAAGIAFVWVIPLMR